MSRISNLTKYPYDYNITEKDFVIGTDGDNKKTKNFPVVALAEYVRNFNNNLSYDRVISIGEITSENNNITINVNDLGNVVYINHIFYTKNTPDTFTFTPVTEGVKVILLYALPDEQIFYMLEGVQSIEAVEPTLPSGALFVQRIIVTVDGIEIIPNNIIISDNKVQITENTSFANIGQSQKDFNKNVSDYKINVDLKNQEQDNRLTDIEGENIAQNDLINDLSSELDFERDRNDAQDSRLENLEGINYVWSPTNRTLTLFDNNGTQLSQVSLVSLDNEGTDIRYNASTLSLELYNADNELLYSIPVSSFIGSVGTQLQLNSSQLQLKDSQGNILSTVNFLVSNINGLQAVLDTKFDKEKFSPLSENYIPFLHGSSYFFNSPFYVDTTNYYVGLNKTNPTEYLDVNGNVKATGFKTPSGTSNQALTADGNVFDLTTKADLVDGKVPSSQLPAYVDDVLEFANLSNFPTTGESGKIYIAIDTNVTYRWTGTGYAEISASLALGETANTAYRGDRGKIAYDHSQTTGNPHNTTKSDIGLGNVNNTSDLDKPISTATQNYVINNYAPKNTPIFNNKIVIRDNAIENIGTNGTSSIAINYVGYNSGTSYYRDLYIYDGKGSTVAIFDGQSKSLYLTGNLTANSLIKSGGTSSQYLMADGSVSTLTNPITGTGTTNYLPKFLSSGTVGNSLIYDDGTSVGIGTTNPDEMLDVGGNIKGINIKDQYGTLKSQRPITITGNTTLSEIHNGAILNVTNTCNITIPTGLDANFQCVIFVKGSVIVTFVNGGVTVYAPSGLLLKTDKMASLISTSTNNFNLTGELATS